MRDFVLVTGVLTAAILMVVAALFWLVFMLSTPGGLAQIEQLRQDAAQVDPAQAEDVIGQVTEANQRISSTQSYNRQWWAGWAIPEEWAEVDLIEVPRE